MLKEVCRKWKAMKWNKNLAHLNKRKMSTLLLANNNNNNNRIVWHQKRLRGSLTDNGVHHGASISSDWNSVDTSGGGKSNMIFSFQSSLWLFPGKWLINWAKERLKGQLLCLIGKGRILQRRLQPGQECAGIHEVTFGSIVRDRSNCDLDRRQRKESSLMLFSRCVVVLLSTLRKARLKGTLKGVLKLLVLEKLLRRGRANQVVTWSRYRHYQVKRGSAA